MLLPPYRPARELDSSPPALTYSSSSRKGNDNLPCSLCRSWTYCSTLLICASRAVRRRRSMLSSTRALSSAAPRRYADPPVGAPVGVPYEKVSKQLVTRCKGPLTADDPTACTFNALPLPFPVNPAGLELAWDDGSKKLAETTWPALLVMVTASLGVSNASCAESKYDSPRGYPWLSYHFAYEAFVSCTRHALWLLEQRWQLCAGLPGRTQIRSFELQRAQRGYCCTQNGAISA